MYKKYCTIHWTNYILRYTTLRALMAQSHSISNFKISEKIPIISSYQWFCSPIEDPNQWHQAGWLYRNTGRNTDTTQAENIDNQTTENYC